MAAASGTPQNEPKPKKEITPEQRKLYIGLGVIGVLTLIVGAMYLPGLLGGSSTPTVATAPTTAETTVAPPPPTDTGAPPGAPGAPEGEAAAAAPAAATTTSTVALPLMRSRPDPFVKLYFIPTPTPIPPPPPRIPPPVTIPSPVNVPFPVEGNRISLSGPARAGSSSQAPLNLPPVTINRLDEAARRPTDAFPPQRTVGAATGGGTINPSLDKRLSGVVIADGVRAILEIQRGGQVVTRVVQPGDEVDGITVLNIQRFNDGTRTVTRMIIRENGEERSVDLRASPQQSIVPGGGPGE